MKQDREMQFKLMYRRDFGEHFVLKNTCPNVGFLYKNNKKF